MKSLEWFESLLFVGDEENGGIVSPPLSETSEAPANDVDVEESGQPGLDDTIDNEDEADDEAQEVINGEDENVVVLGQIGFQPAHGLEIQVIGRLVEDEEMRLDEESTGEGDTHAPSTGHVLGRLLHHLLREAETV